MARFENGYVKFYRKAFFGDIGSNINCLGLWVALLSMATWKETKIRWNGVPRTLPPGSVLIGLRKLADQLGTSKNTISRWLDYLRERDTIGTESSPGGTLVTIRNWYSYQGTEENAGTQNGTQTGREGGHERDTCGPLIEEGKKERKNTARKSGIRRVYSEEFEKVWNLYLKEGNKGEAADALKELNLSPEEFQALQKAIPSYISDCRRKDRRQKFFATFLREDWRVWVPKSPSPGADKDDQAGFDHIRKLNEEALARVKSGGAA